MKFIQLTIVLLITTGLTTMLAQEKMIKTNAEWKKILTPNQYHILREQGTERPFTGNYHDHHKKGIYHCAACQTPLFESKTKFNSGTGWPSFWDHIKDHIAFKTDHKYGWNRTEILCNTCDGHLGHIFNDGPKDKTGKRYCVNSGAMRFRAEDGMIE